jgi:hypothetical protein
MKEFEDLKEEDLQELQKHLENSKKVFDRQNAFNPDNRCRRCSPFS